MVVWQQVIAPGGQRVTVGAMDTITLLLSLTLAVVGGVAAGLLVRLAHRRALAQPLDVEPEAERRVVAGAIAHPPWLAEGEALEGTDFSDEHLGQLWDVLKAAWAEQWRDDDTVAADTVVELLEDRFERAELIELAVEGRDLGRDEYVRSGESVMVAYEDRTVYTGRGGTVVDDDGRWHRDLPAPSRLRHVVVGVLCAAGFGAMPWLAASAHTAGSAAWALVVATGVLMVAMGLVISLVDIDTLRIDLGPFAVTGTLCWLGAVGVGVLAGQLGVVVVAAVATLVVVGLFEVLNFVHRRLRGHDGQGFGDTLLALVCIGVPVALHGDGLLAYWSLMLAVSAVVVTYVVRLVRGEDKERAKLNPFGPYLAGSWVVAWAGMAVGILPTL